MGEASRSLRRGGWRRVLASALIVLSYAKELLQKHSTFLLHTKLGADALFHPLMQTCTSQRPQRSMRGRSRVGCNQYCPSTPLPLLQCKRRECIAKAILPVQTAQCQGKTTVTAQCQCRTTVTAQCQCRLCSTSADYGKQEDSRSVVPGQTVQAALSNSHKSAQHSSCSDMCAGRPPPSPL